jgi:chromosome partitioning protein
VANTKGGVAKTTTCLSLGGGLADQGRLVLLVDLDPQAHLTSSMGLSPKDLRRTVSDVLLGHSSLTAVSRETPVYGLDVAPANNELVVIERILYKHPGYEHRLKTGIEQMHGGSYDIILMDCPPTFGTATINALTAADLLVVPMPCEHYAVQALGRMLDMVRVTRRKTNPCLNYRLLVTMYDMRNRVHPLILRSLRDRFPEALFETMIQVDTKLRESPAFAKPITAYAPRTRAARQYTTLARELIDHLDRRPREGVASLIGAGTGSAALAAERARQPEDAHTTRVLALESPGEGMHIRQVAPGGNSL